MWPLAERARRREFAYGRRTASATRRHDVRNGFDGIKVTYTIDADAKREDIEALVAQSQKRSAVYDIIANPTNVTVEVK